MAQIGSRKKGVRKQLKKLQQGQLAKSRDKVKHTKRSIHGDSVPREPVDYTEESVKALCRLTKINATSKHISETVFQHTQKKTVPAKKSEMNGESSAFTNNDFEDFAKEYDFSKIK
ncbi:uncharacterized protein LOC128212906 isoform X2 [Mya arenaria]|nr:uncharacterized protein LOC128212906 isoform X2 [Mya arenaria]XP_052774276.1 uncharacterized protein LOC128212906 isoform X2 [Mya arenaria]XP_052774285.1 uncharacterized protein LOC128212906 isoform X2 [Mya arenaria]XP_052774293.1 uncharacterized protein LOC128212906 isoform X2 [Mya arenaria]